MAWAKTVIIAVLVGHGVPVVAIAGERTTVHDRSLPASAAKKSERQASEDRRAPVTTPLDRVAFAVDAAESSHGRDMAMWRPDPSGPQGPMQVSEAAAIDVGGGDRFDTTQNRAIGRAYLAQLHWRYRNWPDAIAAYNLGGGQGDAWIKAGRPSEGLLIGVTAYLRRVLHDSGLCDDPAFDRFAPTRCSDLDAGGGAVTPRAFQKSLDRGMKLALQHSSAAP